jgi:RNA polymerase sigma factor (sigma-70 family)
VHEKVSELPEPEREVIRLSYYLDMSQEEIARSLNLSVSTVKRRLNQALYLLHQALDSDRAAPGE